MRRKRLLLVPAVLLLLALPLGIAAHRFFRGEPPAGAQAKRVTIPAGARFRDVCGMLEKEGVLRDARWFYLAGRLGGADRKVRAGIYRLVPGTPGGRLLDLLVRGSNEIVRVTVPEGLRVGEVARILAASLSFSEEEIARIAADPSLAESLGVPGPTLEGYLFPETYLFFATDPPRKVVRRMVETFRTVFTPARAARAAALGLTPREAVTLASIIESEAVVPDERPRISAVYHNRLRLGWKLQADPTVQYALGNREKLLLADLEADSPYNTYRHAGLPPGPICSPGVASIDAALAPTPGSREMYFVASGGAGRHVFTTTLADHGRAKRRAKELRDSP